MNILNALLIWNYLQNPEKYANIQERIIGQVWDSAAHYDKPRVALPMAIFPKNKPMEMLLASFLWLHFTSYTKLKRHYISAQKDFFENLCRAPALVYASKTDNIGTVDFITSFSKRWQENGIPVTYKCFEDSPHIKHYQKYPEEYLNYLQQHWNRVGLLQVKEAEQIEPAQQFKPVPQVATQELQEDYEEPMVERMRARA